MTMSVTVTNTSDNYRGQVVVIDHYQVPVAKGVESIPDALGPGETREYYLHDSCSIRVEEVEEIK